MLGQLQTCCPCWRVMIALEEKNLQGYGHKLLSIDQNEHKSEQVLDLNPRGQKGHLPTFNHGVNVVNESYGACFYLENQFKSQGTKLIPDSAAEQALMYQCMFEGLTLYEKLNSVKYYNWFVPEAERHESALKRNWEVLDTELQLWEGQTIKPAKVSQINHANSPEVSLSLFRWAHFSYLAGSFFSLANVLVFPTVASLFRFGLPAGRFPQLSQYYAALKELPSIKASWPPHWLDNPQRQDTLKDLFSNLLQLPVCLCCCCRLPAGLFPQLSQYYTALKERPSIRANWPPHWLDNPQGQDTLKDF
ncbi:glutathione S-transferase A-like [Genypterus blacodes]|uniref:glutathione S-transferase A-like n=1 Tax=Genypterus blacodes TaxID=154954 RepID=UPI003F7639C9